MITLPNNEVDAVATINALGLKGLSVFYRYIVKTEETMVTVKYKNKEFSGIGNTRTKAKQIAFLNLLNSLNDEK